MHRSQCMLLSVQVLAVGFGMVGAGVGGVVRQQQPQQHDLSSGSPLQLFLAQLQSHSQPPRPVHFRTSLAFTSGGGPPLQFTSWYTWLSALYPPPCQPVVVSSLMMESSSPTPPNQQVLGLIKLPGSCCAHLSSQNCQTSQA
jgi:hypothetical protein